VVEASKKWASQFMVLIQNQGHCWGVCACPSVSHPNFFQQTTASNIYLRWNW